MGVIINQFPKEKFLELISGGMVESEALKQIGFQKGTYIQLQLKDGEFKDAVEQAKRDRADKWFSDIAKSVQQEILSKDEVPAAKLKFEQRKYLAAIDNPDKYAEKRKTEMDINVNIFQEMKELPTGEAKKLLASVDPFNIPIPAEFSVETPASGQGPEEEDIFS